MIVSVLANARKYGAKCLNKAQNSAISCFYLNLLFTKPTSLEHDKAYDVSFCSNSFQQTKFQQTIRALVIHNSALFKVSPLAPRGGICNLNGGKLLKESGRNLHKDKINLAFSKQKPAPPV